jgi:hypothetical protein
VAELEVDEPILQWSVSFAQRGIAVWYFFIGALCLFAPDSWYGPTWSFFQQIPHGGHGLGITCLALGVVMVFAIWRRKRRLMKTALGLGATSFYVAAWLIAAQGIIGGTGLMESPFMMYVAFDIGIQSTVLATK